MDEVSVRVGDAERRDVDARLQQAVGDGRLTLHEYDDRAGQVWAARTRAELDATVQDLPAVVAPAAVSGRRRRPRRAVAVMSGDVLSGPLEPGQGVEAYAVMGGATVDLRGEELPGHVYVRAVAVMGGVEVLVPRGATVHLSGVAFMGGREVRVDPPRPGGRVIDVSAYAMMGGVEVKHGNAPAGRVVSLHKEQPMPGYGSADVRPDWRPDRHGSDRHGPDRPGRRPGHQSSWVRRVVIGVAVVAAAFGVTGVVGSTDPAVFGSSVVPVTAGQSVNVGALFGSVKVVVPDGVAVVSTGTMIFGSDTCKICTASGGGQVVHVHARGAFGSVEIVRAGDQGDDN